MDEEVSYAVFVKMKPVAGCRDPQWVTYSPWYANHEDAVDDMNAAMRDWRVGDIEIRARYVRYAVDTQAPGRGGRK